MPLLSETERRCLVLEQVVEALNEGLVTSEPLRDRGIEFSVAQPGNSNSHQLIVRVREFDSETRWHTYPVTVGKAVAPGTGRLYAS